MDEDKKGLLNQLGKGVSKLAGSLVASSAREMKMEENESYR